MNQNIDVPYEDLITGEKFIQLAQVALFDRSFRSLAGIHTAEPPPHGGVPTIFYTDSSFVLQAFEQIPKDRPIVLISHNGDANITDGLAAQLPPNVTKWFAQNVNTNHPKLHSLPIGLENDQWFPHLQKKHKIVNRRRENRQPSKLLYMNHAIWTNPAARSRPYELLSDKPWVTAIQGKNGEHFDQYLDSICDHRFVVSPEGNGIDAHRTWETLYLNRIPVMLKNGLMRFYSDLPILFIDDWSVLTEEFLRQESIKMQNSHWCHEKLKFSYWKESIEHE